MIIQEGAGINLRCPKFQCGRLTYIHAHRNTHILSSGTSIFQRPRMKLKAFTLPQKKCASGGIWTEPRNVLNASNVNDEVVNNDNV